MKYTKSKLMLVSLGVLSLLMFGNFTMASETTGELSTGIGGTSGNTVDGTVIVPPTANPVAGTYDSAQNVTLSAAGSTSIRYTIDSSIPSCSSGTLYSSAISIDSTKTIKAISCYPENNSSSVVSYAYTITRVDGTTQNVVLTSGTSGQAELPPGSTNVELSNNTVMDLSANVSSATAGQVNVGGEDKTLSSFTSGNLEAEDLSQPKTFGDKSVTVKEAVTLKSGTIGQAIILTNRDLANVEVSIPDSTTVLAPVEWDGKINPPKSGSSAGNAPSGFSVGSTVIEVGSSDGVLLFDKPVAIVLSGVTGNVGYKPAGSSNWIRITATCGGSYASPSAPTFPNECYISNGTDTKIYTYHFTSFGSLNTVATVGGGGGGSYTPPASANLTGLILSGNPTGYTFSGSTYSYTGLTVAKDVSSITITPIGTGTITVNGSVVASGVPSSPIALTAGVEKTITVVTTETGKSPKTYTIKVTRQRDVETPTTPTIPGLNLPYANPTTPAEIEANREVLLKYLVALILSLSSSTTTPVTPTPSMQPFNTTLTLGMNNNEVKRLQEFLATQGSDIYPEGYTTGYFGDLTMKAVGRFQMAHGIVSSESDGGYGIVGPRTRAKINSILGY